MEFLPFILDISGAAPDHFEVRLSGLDGATLAQTGFTWRTETLAFQEDLSYLEALAFTSEDDLQHLTAETRSPMLGQKYCIDYGQRLHRALLGGKVGMAFSERLLANPQHSIPIILRIDPITAQPLSRLPWELLHNGNEFLALNPRTSISRLPPNVPLQRITPVSNTLRLLAVVSNPDDLPENLRLDIDAERERILISTENLQREGRLEVVFLEDASLDAIKDALANSEFHILHFTGHGNFDRKVMQGVLMLEDEQGHCKLVSGQEFTKILQGSSLRLIVLNACRTAMAAHHVAYQDLASQITATGFCGSLAMQYSLEDRAAIAFTETLYQALSRGEDLHTAVAHGRSALLKSQASPIAHASPVAFVIDPLCLQVDRTVVSTPKATTASVDFGLLPKLEHGFVARGRELRQIRRSFESGKWVAAIIYGVGGIGKSALASKVGVRLLEEKVVFGVKVITCNPSLNADSMLAELNDFLILIGDQRLNAVIHQPVPLQSKVAVLAEALKEHSFLIIFDKVEDCLKKGDAFLQVNQTILNPQPNHLLSSQAFDTTDFKDTDLGKQIAQLLSLVSRNTFFLFTSRIDFEPIRPEQEIERVGHIPLGELSFVAVVQLMNRYQSLEQLSVREEVGRISKQLLYEKLGGHPWALDQFARQTERAPLQDVLKQVEDLRGEMLAFTMIQSAIGELPDRAALLLHRVAIYDEAVPVEGLAFMLGNNQDVMPDVNYEVATLLNWGLLTQSPSTEMYRMPSLVRNWVKAQITEEERPELLRFAGRFWKGKGGEWKRLDVFLYAHHYFFEAQDYEEADFIVEISTEYFFRWGQIEILIGLLTSSILTIQGNRRAEALIDLATTYQRLGDYSVAIKYYEQALIESQELSNRLNVAAVLHQLGNLRSKQGQQEQARELYERALAIFQEMDDKQGVANSLSGLGVLYEQWGKYEKARELSRQALAIFHDLEDKAGIASCMQQLALIHFVQAEYAQAQELYEKELMFAEEIGDKWMMARSFHELGIMHQRRMEYSKAVDLYEHALAIKIEVGDRVGIVNTLFQLAVLHAWQGEHKRGYEGFELTLARYKELGHPSGVANSLHSLGNLDLMNGEFSQAKERYEESLLIRRDLGDWVGVAEILHQLGMTLEAETQYSQALHYFVHSFLIFEKLGLGDKQINIRSIGRIRYKLGVEEFNAALHTVDQVSSEAFTDSDDNYDSLTLDQVMTSIGAFDHSSQPLGQSMLSRFLGTVRHFLKPRIQWVSLQITGQNSTKLRKLSNLKSHSMSKEGDDPTQIKKSVCPHCGWTRSVVIKAGEEVSVRTAINVPCPRCGKIYHYNTDTKDRE